jgi:hypothetical protein
VWRLGVWFIPLVGLALTLAAVTWGVGGWLVAAWDSRRRHAPPDPLLPPAIVPDDDDSADADWEPPLPPLASSARPHDAGDVAEERSDEVEGESSDAPQ